MYSMHPPLAAPPFNTATLVYALYCDGGSWSGNAAAPISAKPNSTAPTQTIYYRGRPLLDALCAFPHSILSIFINID